MAKKPSGHRANKNNDSFGTINNENLYRNAYRKDVYKDDEEQEVETPPAEEAATVKENTSFVESKQADEVDFKKRYDDLKKHYDQKLETWKTEKSELENAIKESVSQKTNVQMPKTPEE